MPIATILDVQTRDPALESWKDFIDFLVWLKEERNANYIDFLACNLWKSNDWKYIINTIKSQHNIHIRASIDVTGNGGNFILESDNVDTIGIYFTEQIVDYKYSFYYSTNTFYTKNSISLPIPIDASNGAGLVTVDNLSTFFGKRSTTTGLVSGWQNTALASDLSNVVYVISNERATAALLSNGNVVCWGWDLYGGNCSSVASQLYNIKKIIGSNSAFTALRSDGAVYSWGSADSTIDINTARTANIPPSAVNLTNCKDIYANYNGFCALKNDNTVVTWANATTSYDLTTITNITKIVASENYLAALSSTSNTVILWGQGSYISTAGKVTQTILDVWISNTNIYCLCQSGSTLTLQNVNGAVLYTLPAGVTVKQYIQMNAGNYIFHFSDNSIRVSIAGAITFQTNIVQVITNDYCYMGLKADGTVVAGGDSRFGANLANVPSGLINNIVRLYSTQNSIGALKSDGTFIYFGLMGVYSYYYATASNNIQLLNPGDYANFQNINTIYESYGGYVFVYNNGTIKSIGKYGKDIGVNSTGVDAGTAYCYTLPAVANKNLVLFPFGDTAIVAQVTPYEYIYPNS